MKLKKKKEDKMQLEYSPSEKNWTKDSNRKILVKTFWDNTQIYYVFSKNNLWLFQSRSDSSD